MNDFQIANRLIALLLSPRRYHKKKQPTSSRSVEKTMKKKEWEARSLKSRSLPERNSF
jgi:hypothetical protein